VSSNWVDDLRLSINSTKGVLQSLHIVADLLSRAVSFSLFPKCFLSHSISVISIRSMRFPIRHQRVLKLLSIAFAVVINYGRPHYLYWSRWPPIVSSLFYRPLPTLSRVRWVLIIVFYRWCLLLIWISSCPLLSYLISSHLCQWGKDRNHIKTKNSLWLKENGEGIDTPNNNSA